MAVYSIVETAKANELDPKKYLNYLLGQRPNKEMTDMELDKIAPWSEDAKLHCSI